MAAKAVAAMGEEPAVVETRVTVARTAEETALAREAAALAAAVREEEAEALARRETVTKVVEKKVVAARVAVAVAGKWQETTHRCWGHTKIGHARAHHHQRMPPGYHAACSRPHI